MTDAPPTTSSEQTPPLDSPFPLHPTSTSHSQPSHPQRDPPPSNHPHRPERLHSHHLPLRLRHHPPLPPHHHRHYKIQHQPHITHNSEIKRLPPNSQRPINPHPWHGPGARLPRHQRPCYRHADKEGGAGDDSRVEASRLFAVG